MGAAGARAAKVLASAGLRVVGVEAGGWLPAEKGWFERTLPGVRRPGDAGAAAGPENSAPMQTNGSAAPGPDGSAPLRAEVPTEPAPMANAVGGSNHRSARQSYRLDLDATPARWPLTTAELLPYYKRVERAVGAEPSPPAAWTEAMHAAAARFGWETVAAPVATVEPLGERELGPLIASGLLEVLTETVAVELLTGGDGSVIGAEVVGPAGRDRIEAKRVILATQTFENVRLLLLSRSASHPDGIGNSTGRVGGGLATHNLLHAHGHFPGRDLGRRSGAPGHAAAVLDFDRENPAGDNAFRGGSILQAAMGTPDPDRVVAATGLSRDQVREVGAVWAQPEQLARAENRLELDPTRLDLLGRPLLVATHDLDDEDRARADFLLDRMEEWLRAAGATRTWRSQPRPITIATHAYGGTTMGADPAASVVDGHCQVHDAPGLFVLGGSTFPATGGRGPTETIEALAWRTADRIAGELVDPQHT